GAAGIVVPTRRGDNGRGRDQDRSGESGIGEGPKRGGYWGARSGKRDARGKGGDGPGGSADGRRPRPVRGEQADPVPEGEVRQPGRPAQGNPQPADALDAPGVPQGDAPAGGGGRDTLPAGAADDVTRADQGVRQTPIAA